METLEATLSLPLDLPAETKTRYPVGYPGMFVLFHEANPALYSAIVEHARKLRARGYTMVGVRYLFEHERYNKKRDPFESFDFVALNNNFSPWYARLAEEQEPDLAGFFRTRRTREEMAAADSSQTKMEFD